MVSASKLKTDFKRYERDEIENLSVSEVSEYIESLVAELMKDYKNGAVLGNPDAYENNDLIDNFVDSAKYKFNNLNAVILDRKFRYLANAYFTASVNAINHVSDLRIALLSELVISLIYSKIELTSLLELYYDNYSNHKLLNDLFFKLSTADDLDVTFEIHETYLNNEFGVNNRLMKDLDFLIESKVKIIFDLFERIETAFNVDEISADDYFDNFAAETKSALKNNLSNLSDFERNALINSGYDSALFHELEIVKTEIKLIGIYSDVKEWFMNLYNDNGFAELTAERFKSLNKLYPERYDDIDEYMKDKPKYDLKKFELILPEIKRIAY